MTVALCLLATVLGPPCARGGEAIGPDRGGQAVAYLQPVPYLREWTCIHQHEAAWNDTRDPYWGGLQMDRSFMSAWGRDMMRKYGGRFADAWSPRDQMLVAERARKVRGWHPWPNTARACGLL